MKAGSLPAGIRAFIGRWGLERRAGLLYFCDRSPSSTGLRARPWQGGDDWTPEEPSTIWTELPVSAKASKEALPSYPAYRDLRPGQRRRYLDWLASEALDDSVPEAYANLYYLGLERRCFGNLYQQAWREIVALRKSFPESPLLNGPCEHALAASGLVRGDWDCLAALVAQEVFDLAEPGLKDCLLHFLVFEGAIDEIPRNWLIEAVGGKEARTEFALARFDDKVRSLLHARPLPKRFDDAAGKGPSRELKFSLANTGRPFPDPGPWTYLPNLSADSFLDDFRVAWKEAVLVAKIEEQESRDTQTEERVSLEAAQRELFEDWKRYDVAREIRRAAALREQGESQAACEQLERLLGRAEINKTQRSKIQRMRAVYGCYARKAAP